MAFPDRIYAALPVAAQDAAASAFGLYRYWLRFGQGYSTHVSEYRQRERWTDAQLAAFQSEQLVCLLRAASDYVPYYRLNWSDAQKAAARQGRLAELPLLPKGPVRANPDAFARTDVSAFPRFTFRTSGSSGTPVSTFWTVDEVRKSRALREVRSANWAGTSFREGRATFSGRLVVPNPASTGPFHRFNRVENQIYFSAYHLSPNNARQYVDALWDHKTQWLTGYAVSFYLLARYILDQGLQVPLLKAVVTTSEKLTPQMRCVMEAAYKCHVLEEYGSVENSMFASECEFQRLHVSQDAGVVEILRPDGSCCEPGEAGEVVATGFIRQYQPFVRYQIGDIASWSGEPCPCGRHMPVLQEVVGRVEDVIVGPDGREMVRFHGVFVGLANVVEGQVVQEEICRIAINVVPTPEFNKSDEQELVNRVRQRLGNVEVLVFTVASIPRSKSGKFRAVVSKVSRVGDVTESE